MSIKLSADVFVGQNGEPCAPIVVYCPLSEWLWALRVSSNVKAFINKQEFWVNRWNAKRVK